MVDNQVPGPQKRGEDSGQEPEGGDGGKKGGNQLLYSRYLWGRRSGYFHNYPTFCRRSISCGGKEKDSNDRKTETWAPALQKHNFCVTSTQQRWVGTECILYDEVGSNHLHLLWGYTAGYPASLLELPIIRTNLGHAVSHHFPWGKIIEILDGEPPFIYNAIVTRSRNG